MRAAMSFFNQRQQQFIWIGDTESMLLKLGPQGGGKKELALLSRLPTKAGVPPDLAALVAGTGTKKSALALVMPLAHFEMVGITVPPVGDEAINKMLPFRLSKVLDSPVSDYLFDWQTSQVFKDRQELTVYLYPAAQVEEYRQLLAAHRKELVRFEPDVFSGCAYLLHEKDLPEDVAFLAVFVWKRSISIAVCENQRISLVRSIDLEMPELEPGKTGGSTGFDRGETTDIEQNVGGSTGQIDQFFVVDEKDGEIPGMDESSEINGVLADFGLQDSGGSKKQLSMESIEAEEATPEFMIFDPWQEYFENLKLELMRTIDYHSSVLKGRPIRTVYVGGAETFFDQAVEAARVNEEVAVQPVAVESISAELVPTLAALALGAMKR